MTSSFEALLGPLCREFGIDTEYWDIWGSHHRTEESTLLAILSAFGLDTATPARLEASAEARYRRMTECPLDSVAVLSVSDESPEVPLRAPAGAQVLVALRWEDGWIERQEITIAAHQETLRLPTPLRLGYHDLELTVHAAGGKETRATQRVIVAPEEAWLPDHLRQGGRAAGLAVSLYGVRSERNWGVGDFTDLAALCRWAADSLGAGFVALNPLHALHNRQPYNTSPYLPLSIYQRNFLYLDVEAVEDFDRCEAAAGMVRPERFQAELAALRESEFVEYERVARLKKGVLRLLFRRFLREEWRKSTARARQFRAWEAEQGELLSRFARLLRFGRGAARARPEPLDLARLAGGVPGS